MRTLGIDLGGTNTKLVVLDGDRVVARHDFPSRGSDGPGTWVASLARELPPLLEDSGEIGAVGFAMAGLVDLQGQVVCAPNLPSYVGVDLADLVESVVGRVPVAVQNDVNAAIVGEHRLGAGRGCHHLAMFSLGTGVGGGLILSGRLYNGSGGLAGELGHLILDPEGPVCTCGKRGHVESYLSTEAIVRRAREALGKATPEQRGALEAAAAATDGAPTPRALARAAGGGDPLARGVLEDCGHWLAVACVSVVHALHPAKVIVGGGVSAAGDLLLEPARREFRARAMTPAAAAIPLVQAELGVDGAAVGAAILGRDLLDGGPSQGT